MIVGGTKPTAILAMRQDLIRDYAPFTHQSFGGNNIPIMPAEKPAKKSNNHLSPHPINIARL
jgi:hypothetical protein